MIKQMRASYFHNFKNAQYCALSDDPIPDDLENGDEVYIIDQGKIYYWDESSSSLYEYKGGRGGSGGSSSFVPCFGSLATVSLGTTWSGDDPYVSTVTVTGYTVTNQTMVSVLPSSDVVEQMLADGITNIFITNNDGVLTATVIGATPTVPMTLQVLCTESDISSDIAGLPSIVGSGIIQTVEADNLTDAVNILGEDVDDLKNAISELDDAVYGTQTIDYGYSDITWSDGYLNLDGSFQSHAAYKTSAYIEVLPGTTVAYDGLRSISGNYLIIAAYTEGKSFVSDAKVAGTGGKDTGTYTVPSTVHYIRVVTYNYYGENYFEKLSVPKKVPVTDLIEDEITDIQTEQTQQNTRITSLEDELKTGYEYTVDGFDEYEINITGGIATNGTDFDYQYAYRSDYISTENIVSITAHIKAINRYECGIASYDANKGFISAKSLVCYDAGQDAGSWIYVDGTIEIGDNVKFIRITRASNDALNSDDTIITVRTRPLTADYEATKETVNKLVADASIWKGKKWYAFGSSLTDNTYLDPNGDPTGKYPALLNQYMQANLVNKGKGGGGITSHSNGAILTAIQNTDFSDADLVTLEGFPNDYSAAPGDISDTTTDTLCGALYVALTAIYNTAPNATVVLITASQGQLNQQGTAGYPIDFVSATGNLQVDYNNAIIKMGQYFGCHVIDAGGKAQINNYHPEYLVDHIHHSWAGGWQYAATIWEEMQKIHANTSNPYLEDEGT